MMKSQLFLFALGAILLTSCMGSKKYSQIVNEKLWAIPKNEIDKKDQIKVFSDQLSDSSTQFIQEKNSFIPALVYWGWNSTVSCDLNDNITSEWLTASIYKAADSLRLYDKLRENKLEIHLERVPGKFYYENKGHGLILLVANSVSTFESITPEPIDLVATYRIVNGDELKSKGKIIIPNIEKPIENFLKSTKKFTWTYLDRHAIEVENMGWYLVEDIIDRI